MGSKRTVVKLEGVIVKIPFRTHCLGSLRVMLFYKGATFSYEYIYELQRVRLLIVITDSIMEFKIAFTAILRTI